MTEPREALAYDAEQERAKILAMRPGPELNALVAEKIFSLTPCDGWLPMNFGSAGGPALAKRCDHAPDTCYSTRTIGSIQGRIGGAPPYSTDAGAAWSVVERLKSPAQRVIIHVWDNEVRVWIKPGWSSVYGPGAGAETFPLAVCRAALTTKAALLATLEARSR